MRQAKMQQRDQNANSIEIIQSDYRRNDIFSPSVTQITINLLDFN